MQLSFALAKIKQGLGIQNDTQVSSRSRNFSTNNLIAKTNSSENNSQLRALHQVRPILSVSSASDNLVSDETFRELFDNAIFFEAYQEQPERAMPPLRRAILNLKIGEAREVLRRSKEWIEFDGPRMATIAEENRNYFDQEEHYVDAVQYKLRKQRYIFSETINLAIEAAQEIAARSRSGRAAADINNLPLSAFLAEQEMDQLINRGLDRAITKHRIKDPLMVAAAEKIFTYPETELVGKNENHLSELIGDVKSLITSNPGEPPAIPLSRVATLVGDLFKDLNTEFDISELLDDYESEMISKHDLFEYTYHVLHNIKKWMEGRGDPDILKHYLNATSMMDSGVFMMEADSEESLQLAEKEYHSVDLVAFHSLLLLLFKIYFRKGYAQEMGLTNKGWTYGSSSDITDQVREFFTEFPRLPKGSQDNLELQPVLAYVDDAEAKAIKKAVLRS